MRKLSFMLSLLIISATALAQKEPMKFGKIPPEDLDLKMYAPDTAAEAVVLGDFGEVKFGFSDDNVLYHFSRHKRIKIFKRSGFDQGDILIPFYSKGRLEDISTLKAQVIAPNGEKTEVSKKEFFEEAIDRNWSRMRFALPNLQEGSIIEYEYEIVSKAIFQLPEWYFQEDIPVRWSELRLEIPEWYDYVFITQGKSPDILERNTGSRSFYIPGKFSGSGSVDARTNHTRFVMKDVPALKEESFITTMDDYYARMRFQLSSVKYPNGPVEPVMSTWEKLAQELLENGDFGGRFLKKRNYDEVWEAAQAVLAGVSSPEEKVSTLHNFILSNVSLEEGRGVTTERSLNDCFKKKSARSYEMNLLMVALLKEAGVEAHPVLISTRDHGKPMPLYPLVDQFDHVLVIAVIGEKTMLLDLANPMRPSGFPAVGSLNYLGWAVIKDNPQWIEISAPSGSDTYLLAMALDDEGGLQGKLTINADGYSAVNERESMQQKPGGTHLKERLAETFPDIRIDSVRFENEKDLSKPFRAYIDCTLPNMATVSGDFLYLSPVLISSFAKSPFKSQQRSYPVDFSYPIKEQVVMNLDLPAGYVVEDLPESVKLALPDNSVKFQFQVGQRDNMLQIISNLQISKLRFEPEEYDALRNFFSLVEEKLGGQVVLKKE